jgi:hypothetical protein
MEKSLQSYKPSPDVYFQGSSKRRWELSYGGKDRFYLTDKERDGFLKAVWSGAETIQVGDLTLSKFIKYLVPVRGSGVSDPLPEPPIISQEQRIKNLDKLNKIRDKFQFLNVKKSK